MVSILLKMYRSSCQLKKNVTSFFFYRVIYLHRIYLSLTDYRKIRKGTIVSDLCTILSDRPDNTAFSHILVIRQELTLLFVVKILLWCLYGYCIVAK